MGLFDFFRSPPPRPHPAFGPLQYSRGRWRGAIELEASRRVALFLPGSREAPSAAALQVAEQAPSWWARTRTQVEAELFVHYEAGRDAGIEGIPQLSGAREIWPHVTISSIHVQPYNTANEYEVALRVAWDEEHTLGALIREGRLEGLNGSILEPR